ncbi:TadE/TadG family type IV pilus assembly protein [Nocardioides limicola]|uniref:TadE/TadG family type IV pilus assembly protein n=1 Tax=Nocardioides limicola TaxID=2803368 RepID=UPI00193B701D|nr:TadE/TadG family type IV pilus assembly protein [Nocardioides sp. DJM-14]
MRRGRSQRGSAVVDFVLLAMILVPLLLGLIHLGLVLHVRNTLNAAASDAARHGARLDRGPDEARARARQVVSRVLAARFADDIAAGYAEVEGAAVLEVRIRATVPPLGLWGPATEVSAVGRSVRERVP